MWLFIFHSYLYASSILIQSIAFERHFFLGNKIFKDNRNNTIGSSGGLLDSSDRSVYSTLLTGIGDWLMLLNSAKHTIQCSLFAVIWSKGNVINL